MAHPTHIFRIIPTSDAEQAAKDGSYAGGELDLTDGFLHMSTASQLVDTIKRYFNQAEGISVAKIAVDKLPAEHVQWEEAPSRPEAGAFPHLYVVPLPWDSVVDISPLSWHGEELSLADGFIE